MKAITSYRNCGLAAFLVVSAGSVALAGGKECRLYAAGTVSGTRVDGATASAVSGLTMIGVGLGYCPGGLPAPPIDSASGSDAGAPDAWSKLDEIDVVEAAAIAKAHLADPGARVYSAKIEYLDVSGEILLRPYWRIDVLTSAKEEWCVTLDPASNEIDAKLTAKASTTESLEDLAARNLEDAAGTPMKPNDSSAINDVHIPPVSRALIDAENDTIDVFEAIALTAEKLEIELKRVPEPVPAQKITDRPHPKGNTNSTGSRR